MKACFRQIWSIAIFATFAFGALPAAADIAPQNLPLFRKANICSMNALQASYKASDKLPTFSPEDRRRAILARDAFNKCHADWVAFSRARARTDNVENGWALAAARTNFVIRGRLYLHRNHPF